MDKEMRIFSSEMLTKITATVPTSTIVQMMQKESMFEQKFVQIGVVGSAAISKTKQTVTNMGSSSIVQIENSNQSTGVVKNEQLEPVVTGILLMMLEDDSMAVRLAGIRTMSCYGQACSEIRSRCLTFLIDMLNDEINDVRIGALHGI